MLLISRKEPDSSAYLDKRGKQHHVCSNSSFDPHIPKAFYRCFGKHCTATCIVYTVMLLGQFNGLFKEVCLNVGADWLNSHVSQTLARGRCNYVSA